MIDVGIVGLDTSHPEAFASTLEQKETVNIAAVWDGGDVRPADHVADFCAQFDAERYDRPRDMIEAVDAAMILTVNWDTHADLVTPFLEAGVATFVDKPIAGHVDGLDRIEESIGTTPLFGGSAVPFHPSLEDFPVAETDRTLYCAGYNDPFYYGAHVVHLIRRFVGADWTTVAPASGPGIVVDVAFENGTRATLRFDGPEEDSAYGILDVGSRTRTRRVDGTQEDHEKMYDRFLDAFVEAIRGDRDDSTCLVDASRLLLAAHAALETGTRVTPESEELTEFSADGEAFLAEYAPYY